MKKLGIILEGYLDTKYINTYQWDFYKVSYSKHRYWYLVVRHLLLTKEFANGWADGIAEPGLSLNNIQMTVAEKLDFNALGCDSTETVAGKLTVKQVKRLPKSFTDFNISDRSLQRMRKPQDLDDLRHSAGRRRSSSYAGVMINANCMLFSPHTKHFIALYYNIPYIEWE